MATAALMESSLHLEFDGGLDAENKPVVKRKNFSNVKTASTADQLFTVATALADLQQYPLITIERGDSYNINS